MERLWISILANTVDNHFSDKAFIVLYTLVANGRSRTYPALVNTGATGYSFIDTDLTHILCDLLKISIMPLSKKKTIGGFSDYMFRTILHTIYPILKVVSNTQFNVLIIIVKLGFQ